jgi:hypothetical protein
MSDPDELRVTDYTAYERLHSATPQQPEKSLRHR